ncbi:MAG: hypothetical protein K6E50_11960 [Lachnospiraceae bacterium]|nr:hypothetical protein [Lachnospiraceae bacterium]
MYDYYDLKKEYKDFESPIAVISVSGKDISKDKKGFAISDIIVELSCGFEASVAEFKIYNGYDMLLHEFLFDDLKKYITLGSPVSIWLGYKSRVLNVFRGFISQVNFTFHLQEMPAVEVHCMDLKGIMMANSYAKQINAQYYCEAVKSVFEQPFYQRLKGEIGVYEDILIADTPDKPEQPQGGGGEKESTDRTIEMVNESDYEFVVRAAKRFNYEFFQSCGTICFRRAKSDTDELMVISPETGMMAFDVGYDITGLVGQIEVRNVDAGKGKLLKASQKLQGKISEGSKAKQLVSKQKKIYIDPTAANQEEAGFRAEYLVDEVSYRFGTLEAEMVGIPELMPGKFIILEGLGTAASNTFYLSSVRHSMEANGFYQTHISGKAANL